MRKGQATRAAIVEAALEQAARAGLEGLTIGALAERMAMSKSGVFAHFGSREELQIAVLRAYGERFVETVLKPALAEPRGLPRLLTVLERWVERTVREAGSGCLWISSATEYDDRPGAVRDELVATLRGWQREVGRAIEAAIAEGHLAAGTDVDDLVFDLHGAILALHHDARLMHSRAAAARARRGIARALQPWLAASTGSTGSTGSTASPDSTGSTASPDSTASTDSTDSTASTTSPRGRRHAPVHAPAP